MTTRRPMAEPYWHVTQVARRRRRLHDLAEGIASLVLFFLVIVIVVLLCGGPEPATPVGTFLP